MGLTTAFELSNRFPEARIAILEKEAGPGKHASGRNSGVLHSGVYYGADTLKARFCSNGAKKMQAFARKYGIKVEQTGKVIVAQNDQDIDVIDTLMSNAKASNIRASILNEAEIREIEPNVNVYKLGLYSPDTMAIDISRVLTTLHKLLIERNVELLFDRPVISISLKQKTIETSKEKYGYHFIYNCAGAYSDLVAKMCGVGKEYVVIPFKGVYFKLCQARNTLVRGNIYPVPDLSFPFLGVHFTRLVNKDIYVGPTAIPALGRENYGIFSGIRIHESIKIFRDIWNIYLHNNSGIRRLIHREIPKYMKIFFVSEAQKLVSSLTSNDLVSSSKVGIRAQLVNIKKSKLESDFVIERGKDTLHMLNAISPAFTCSFALAEHLVDLYEHDTNDHNVRNI